MKEKGVAENIFIFQKLPHTIHLICNRHLLTAALSINSNPTNQTLSEASHLLALPAINVSTRDSEGIMQFHLKESLLLSMWHLISHFDQQLSYQVCFGRNYHQIHHPWDHPNQPNLHYYVMCSLCYLPF